MSTKKRSGMANFYFKKFKHTISVKVPEANWLTVTFVSKTPEREIVFTFFESFTLDN